MSAYRCPKCGIGARNPGDPSVDKVDKSVTWIRYSCGSYYMMKRVKGALGQKVEFNDKCTPKSNFNPLG